jgi:hypothetical protein
MSNYAGEANALAISRPVPNGSVRTLPRPRPICTPPLTQSRWMIDPKCQKPQKNNPICDCKIYLSEAWAKASAAGHQEPAFDRGIDPNGRQSPVAAGGFHARAERLDPPFGPAKPGIRQKAWCFHCQTARKSRLVLSLQSDTGGSARRAVPIEGRGRPDDRGPKKELPGKSRPGQAFNVTPHRRAHQK